MGVGVRWWRLCGLSSGSRADAASTGHGGDHGALLKMAAARSVGTWKRRSRVDQLAGGMQATVPSESLLLPWPEPASADVVSFMKALSWYYTRLPRIHAP